MTDLIEKWLKDALQDHPPVITFRSLAESEAYGEDDMPYVEPLDFGYESE